VTIRLCSAAFMLAVVLGWPALASARVERYAVIIGNDQGLPDATPLRYAESDATRMSEVLREIGGFEPVNMVLLRGEDVERVRSTLIAVNDRIRAAVSEPDTQVVLFVYYSGHADAERLHLGPQGFPIQELAQLVRGSAATFRLVVLDSCRSGALTRLKGGHLVKPFALPDETLPNAGMAYLTASAEGEDAQESDELRGSFFTHALLSGLLGAADGDGDGEVVLDEVYRYAYEATLRATSRTAAGSQHPTFRFDLRGQGELVLTRPLAHATQRTSLSFPRGFRFLLLRNGSEGAVVAEVAAEHRDRMLSVRPGRYFVRARATDVMYEGTIVATAGTSAEVRLDALQRIEYARLVRKGAASAALAHGPDIGVRGRTALPNSTSPCLGAFVGYGADFADASLGARVSGCGSSFEQPMLEATTLAFDIELRVARVWDADVLAFDLGVGAGLAVFSQSFSTRGDAPDRQTAAPFLALGAGVAIDVSSGFGVRADLSAETYFLRVQQTAIREPALRASFALRPSLGLTKRF
jgi:hypothetical protein